MAPYGTTRTTVSAPARYGYLQRAGMLLSSWTESLLKRVLPLRLHIPFVSTRSIFLVGEPNQIEEVLASSSMRHGIIAEPYAPSWLNWFIGSYFFTAPCPVPGPGPRPRNLNPTFKFFIKLIKI
jgi:hypothetical protein